MFSFSLSLWKPNSFFFGGEIWTCAVTRKSDFSSLQDNKPKIIKSIKKTTIKNSILHFQQLKVDLKQIHSKSNQQKIIRNPSNKKKQNSQGVVVDSSQLSMANWLTSAKCMLAVGESRRFSSRDFFGTPERHHDVRFQESMFLVERNFVWDEDG